MNYRHTFLTVGLAVQLAAVSTLVTASPAAAGGETGGIAYAVVPISKLTKITTDTGVNDAHARLEYCDPTVRMEMTATFYVSQADAKSVTVDKVRIQWKSGRAGSLAGAHLAAGNEAHNSKYADQHGFGKGKGAATYDVGKTLKWFGADHEIHWSQNYYLDAENERDIAQCVGDDSNNFWFRLYRAFAKGGACTISATIGSDSAAAPQRYAAASVPTKPC